GSPGASARLRRCRAARSHRNDPPEPPLPSQNHSSREPPVTCRGAWKLTDSVKAARRRAEKPDSDLCIRKFLDNFTIDAAAQVLSGCPPQAATARPRFEPEPDSLRARHFRFV